MSISVCNSVSRLLSVLRVAESVVDARRAYATAYSLLSAVVFALRKQGLSAEWHRPRALEQPWRGGIGHRRPRLVAYSGAGGVGAVQNMPRQRLVLLLVKLRLRLPVGPIPIPPPSGIPTSVQDY